MPDYWNEISRNESELAFIIDMDAQFIFVPKSWTNAVMTIKLLDAVARIVVGNYTHSKMQV